MTIESDDLAILRETTSKTLMAVLWIHVPIAAAIGLLRGADWIVPSILMIAMALAATMSWRISGNGLSTRLTFAVALMGGVSVFAYQLAGHAWQIDMHMYFFAALACLVAYCDSRPIIAGTVAVALHHLVLNFVASGRDLSRRRRLWPRRASRRHPVDRSGRADCAGPQALAAVRDHGPEDRGGRRPQALPKRAPIPNAARPNAGESGSRRRTARTRRRLRAQDRRLRRGGRGRRQRNAGHFIDNEHQQRGNRAGRRPRRRPHRPRPRRTSRRLRPRPKSSRHRSTALPSR